MAAKKHANKSTPAADRSRPPVGRSGVNGLEAGKALTDGAAAPVSGEAKHKLVRDSFTIPKNEYVVLGSLKDRATQLRRPTKKRELLRAGIAALQAMNDRAFLAALAKIPSLKTGRPKEVAEG